MGCRQANFITEAGLRLHYARFHYQQKVSSKCAFPDAHGLQLFTLVLRTRVVHRCSVCREEQTGIDTLRQHMKCHNPSLEFMCDYGCIRTYFPNIHNLNEHLQTKHGITMNKTNVDHIAGRTSEEKELSPSDDVDVTSVENI